MKVRYGKLEKTAENTAYNMLIKYEEEMGREFDRFNECDIKLLTETYIAGYMDAVDAAFRYIQLHKDSLDMGIDDPTNIDRLNNWVKYYKTMKGDD